MSRRFNGSNEEIRFSVSSAVASIPTGDHSIAVLHRPNLHGSGQEGALVGLHTSGGIHQAGYQYFNTTPNRVVWVKDALNVRPPAAEALITDGEWFCNVVRVAAPMTAAGDWNHSIWRESTDAWIHGATSTGFTGTLGPGSSVSGGYIALGEIQDLIDLNGWQAVVAIFGYVLSITQAEELMANNQTSDWWNCSGGPPVWLIELNGAVASPVTDLSGNGGDQSAITGTTQDTGVDPPSWTYDGVGAPAAGDYGYGDYGGGTYGASAELVADVTVSPGAATATAAGSTPTVTVDAAVAPGAADLTASGSTPTVDVSGSPDATVTPGAANLTAAGSTPTVTVDAASSPGAANVTAAGSTPTVTIDAATTPGQANLTAAGSTAPIQGDSAPSPGQATATASGSTPTITADAVAAPGQANLTATGSTPVVTTDAVVDATVTPGQANLAAAGSAATVLITPDPVIPPDAGGGGRYEPGGDETSITGESRRIVAGTASLFASGSRATVLIEEPRAPVRLPRVRVRPRPVLRPAPVVVNRVVVAGMAEARATGSRAVVDGVSVLSMDEVRRWQDERAALERRLEDADEAAVAFLMLTS